MMRSGVNGEMSKRVNDRLVDAIFISRFPSLLIYR